MFYRDGMPDKVLDIIGADAGFPDLRALDHSFRREVVRGNIWRRLGTVQETGKAVYLRGRIRQTDEST